MDQRFSKLRPRFSLLSFLLAVTAICLAVSYWHTAQQLAATQSELRQLRDEFSYIAEDGYLAVDDRTKFHAVAIDCGEPNTWRWRLFLPKGVRYMWNLACEDIPVFSPPSRAGMSAVSYEPYWDSENEVLVTARLRKGDEGNWLLTVTSKIADSKHQMSSVALEIPADKIQWMSTVSSTDGFLLGSDGPDVRDPAGPIILLQRRACKEQPDGSYRSSDGPMPGFMIWLSKW